ncbi:MULTISPECIES: hypothetical protein [Catenuloplanes]|uniref:Excisionase n=1 Tax=Catenuloplanes niger TaxID=587534 RepID=A0AAE3ZP32_9ACTN|nr:hypothetical protein [Catenuloplanes niger]MDR7323347.1 hypothetical protein [Catenuloplanes niger]
MEQDRWLKIKEVAAAWAAAGLPGGEQTIRRMIDDGDFGEVHRTRGRYRLVRASAVAARIRQESPEADTGTGN